MKDFERCEHVAKQLLASYPHIADRIAFMPKLVWLSELNNDLSRNPDFQSQWDEWATLAKLKPPRLSSLEAMMVSDLLELQFGDFGYLTGGYLAGVFATIQYYLRENHPAWSL